MHIKTIQLKDFKRFNDLTIDLENHSKKIIALVGPNGSGKSSVFDGFEQFSTNEREKRARMGYRKNVSYLKKSIFQLIGISSEESDYDSSTHVLVESDQSAYTPTSFYIRSAHRFTPRIEIKQIRALSKIEEDEKRPKYLIDIDSRLEENYERLIGGFFSEVYDKDITGKQWSEKNIQNLNKSLSGILDISIVSLGNPTHEEGSLYFTKGTSSKFPYENLSAGEKEVVDLILDLYIKRDFYSNTVICIDEPELHLSTSIQRKLLIEIEKIIPDTCQLWVATHSIGFLRALQEDLRDKTAVIDFLGNNFDETVVLKPIVGTRKDWFRIFETALEDLTGLLAPKRIVYCEGRPDPSVSGAEQGLDADVYNEIFSNKYPDTLFVSSGGGNVVNKSALLALKILKKAFSTVDLYLLKDKDGSSDQERNTFIKSDLSNKMLMRREIENYLFDKEILKKFCSSNSKTFNESRYDSKVTDIKDQKLKLVQQEILASCQGSGNIQQFKKELAKHVSPDTGVFQEVETSIF
ncbi:MAG: AAA family ATPase [Patescibacteria group bacterium]